MFRSTILAVSILVSSLGAISFLQAQSIASAIELLDPSLTVRVVREGPGGCGPPPRPLGCVTAELPDGQIFGEDAAGSLYWTSYADIFPGENSDGHILVRLTAGGVESTIAKLYRKRCLNGTCTDYVDFEYGSHLVLGLIEGDIKISVRADFFYEFASHTDSSGILEISGLPLLFDTLLTFVPGGQELNTLTPAHPDGFRAADSLQIWYGDRHTLPNWAWSEPLTCEAASNPLSGQLVTITDTLPDPVIGSARYYVVASQSGTNRRLGRQLVDGAFSAREPAGLPVCQ